MSHISSRIQLKKTQLNRRKGAEGSKELWQNAKVHITNLYYIEYRVFPPQSTRDVVPHPIREQHYNTVADLLSANDAEALIGGVT